MGYFRVESFESVAEWDNAIPGTFYTLDETDWPTLISHPSKSKALRLTFDPKAPFTGETFFEKTYSKPIYFSQKDYYNKTVLYPELSFTTLVSPNGEITQSFLEPADFILTIELFDGPISLREWFLPLADANVYNAQRLDLQPLIDAGYEKFDRIRFHILKNGGKRRIYFGDLYLLQDLAKHNLSVALADMLHLKFHEPRTVLVNPANPGDTTIVVDSGVDLYHHTPIIIGDPDGEFELHVIGDYPKESSHPSQDATVFGFTGEFDTEKMQRPWPAGTPVHFAVPASYYDFSDSTAVFPLFYITTGAPDPQPLTSPQYGGQLDSYVRDPNGNHKVAARLSVDALRVPTEIHVYAEMPETAEDMWRFLRSVIDQQSHIYVAGDPAEYEVVSHRQMDIGIPVVNAMPHYILELDCYPVENVHKRKYQTFPALKVLTVSEFAVTEL